MPPQCVEQAEPPHPALQSLGTKKHEHKHTKASQTESTDYLCQEAPMLVYSHLQSASDVAPRSAVVVPGGQFWHVMGPVDTASLNVPAQMANI